MLLWTQTPLGRRDTIPIDDFIKLLLNIEPHEVEYCDLLSNKDNQLTYRLRLKPFTLFCPHCNFSQLVVKEYKIRTIKHVETGNYKTLIHYEARRYECKQCKRTFYETNKFATPQHRVSNLLKINIMEDLKTSTLTYTYVAQKFGLSPTTVIKIFDSNLSIPRLQLPKVLCIDEIHIPMILYKSKYICIFMDWSQNDFETSVQKWTLLGASSVISKSLFWIRISLSS